VSNEPYSLFTYKTPPSETSVPTLQLQGVTQPTQPQHEGTLLLVSTTITRSVWVVGLGYRRSERPQMSTIGPLLWSWQFRLLRRRHEYNWLWEWFAAAVCVGRHRREEQMTRPINDRFRQWAESRQQTTLLQSHISDALLEGDILVLRNNTALCEKF